MEQREFYQSAAAYDRHISQVGDDDVRFWCALVARLGARRVLELGCGSGRVTLPLARALAARGGRVVGLDLSPAMLAGAAEKLAAESVAVRAAVRLVEGDMRSFALDEQFDLVAIPFSTLGHLHTIDDQLACLTAARRHLAPGGHFAVDLRRTPLAELHHGLTTPDEAVIEGTTSDPATGARLVRYCRARYTPDSQTHELDYTDEWLMPDGALRVETTKLTVHVFFQREMELLFRLAGLNVAATYGDHAFGPLTDESPRLVLLGALAAKP